MTRKANAITEVVVYGVGKDVENYFLDEDYGLNKVWFCDNDNAKIGKSIYGNEIMPVEIALTNDYDYVLIGSRKYYEEIESNLIEKHHVNHDRIESIDILRFRSI